MAGAVLAGTIANIDWFSNYFGPSAYLAWHGTYTHSILAAILISAIFFAIFFARVLMGGLGIAAEVPNGNAVSIDVRALRVLILGAFLLPLCAALLHIAMDACQSNGVTLFWPFSSKRLRGRLAPRHRSLDSHDPHRVHRPARIASSRQLRNRRQIKKAARTNRRHHRPRSSPGLCRRARHAALECTGSDGIANLSRRNSAPRERFPRVPFDPHLAWNRGNRKRAERNRRRRRFP